MPAGSKVPGFEMPLPFGKEAPDKAPRTPGADVTGSPAPIQRIDTLPIEELKSLPLPQSAAQGTQAGKDANQPSAVSPPSQVGVPGAPPNSGTAK
jgi:hypothetical protein